MHLGALSHPLLRGQSAAAVSRPRPPVAAAGGSEQPVRWTGKLSLTGQFRWACLVVLIVAMLGAGTWIAQQTEIGALHRTASLTALYVDSALQEPLSVLASQDRLEKEQCAALDHLLHETPLGQRIVELRVWSTTGEVLYSSDADMVGRTFPVSYNLDRALHGYVAADLSPLDRDENASLGVNGPVELLEVYAPVHPKDASGRVLGAVEFYQRPDDLLAEINTSRIQIWGLVGAGTLAIYLLLAGIVHRGTSLIARQQAALRRQFSELEHLHARLREAAGRTTTLNERALRRVGADLHAGPGQALALALLRVETLHRACTCGCLAEDAVGTVRGAVQDAMAELRLIAAGLRLPELEPLKLEEVVARSVDRHTRRSGHPVALQLGALPAQAPLSVKIVLFRALEEGLSNASRHAGGLGLTARVWSADGGIALVIADAGPGFVPQPELEDEHLGLANLREHIELLSGRFAVASVPGRGTRIEAWLPLNNHPDSPDQG
jgi:signal transduction histidine kinase